MIHIRKIAVNLIISLLLVFSVTNLEVDSKTINEADTELLDTLKYALIGSLYEPIDKAIKEIYKGDINAPEGLTWAIYDTEITKIKQTNGIGGFYEVTFKVYPYYRAHNSYGEDEVVVNTKGELVSFRHLKTYPQ
ncbi:DUF3888 domain-containing protein [Fredinandcohnia humi]